MIFVYLDIVREFSCKQCGVCCRNHWLVTVDEAGYRRNQDLFGATGDGAEFRQAFIPLGTAADYGEFARIAKKAAGGCWFLTEQNLCALQQRAGHDHLDAVCQWFPRYPMDTERGIEISLSFSCPAAVQLAVREQPLQIVRNERLPIDMMPQNFVTHVYPSQQPENSALRYYFEMEGHLIHVLQFRKLSLLERLAMVRQTIDSLSRLTAPDTMGRDINRLFQADYDRLDAALARLSAEGPLHWLIENCFVNFIFRKSLYSHGFAKGLKRFDLFQERLNVFMQKADPDDEDVLAASAAIVQLELEYNHNGGK
ncbi:MAG: flagellin lysine-N-methylase [Negativicutes bacterium]